ncbi:hypothetical protein [Pectobacterium phage Wc4-1]|uniref:Uncharacterized protein n=1 Tax=Pectobacterium phage Wc4 TaxID=2652428 RepID=A0A5P8D472_9CAUD|nr:hypothetical protein [Pectobacterium phage Wc4]QFP93938.1 hypothetical protein [Pectobacterium phage Wc4-1]
MVLLTVFGIVAFGIIVSEMVEENGNDVRATPVDKGDRRGQ